MSTEIDLSRLPEPVRLKLQARLDSLPPGIRARLVENLGRLPPERLAEALQRGLPMLDKLVDRLEHSATNSTPRPSKPSAGSTTVAKPASARIAPASATGVHYNNTVQRGDRMKLSLGPIVVVVAGLLLVLHQLGLVEF